MTGGRFEITSEENVGTTVTASFVYDSIDRMPLGDIPSTVSMLAGSRAGTAWTYRHVFKDRSFVFSTDEIQRRIGETDFAAPEIAEFIRDYIGEQLQILYGGNSL